MTLTVTDLFCGAGGSSLGAKAAGLELVMAANHWQTAIDVHQAHFPNAGHDCADISQADPRRYPRTDILLASPECTNHSQARGVSRRQQDPKLWDAPDPTAERSRATMWDVPRFVEQLRYDAGVVENVVEVTKWIFWPAWRMAMEAAGYELQVLSHNSMHHGVPQSRDRCYIVWWRKGLRVDLEMELQAWCPKCDGVTTVRQSWKRDRWVGRYRQQWTWGCIACGTACEPATRPAADIIDWSLECPRIGDRARPLATKTRARILAGLERYGFAPIVTVGAGNGHERTPGNRARALAEPLPTQTTTAQHALATPPEALLMRGYGANGGHPGRHLTPVEEPARTQTANGSQFLVVPMRNNGHVYDPEQESLGTVTAGGNHHGLLMRNNRGGAEMVTPLDEPARTMTTTSPQSLLMPYYGNGQARLTDEPVPTVTTRDRCAVIDPEQVVDDCGFRMLQPHEVSAAMAFPEGYIPRDLPKRDQIKLAGNAVTPPAMHWIVGRIGQALEAA